MLGVTGCHEIRENHPEKVYRLWAGTKPPDKIEVLQGQYWESAHWSKEYIMYLHLKVTADWWHEFAAHNQFILTTEGYSYTDAPEWFRINADYQIYIKKSVFDQGSRVFLNPDTGDCFIAEIQL